MPVDACWVTTWVGSEPGIAAVLGRVTMYTMAAKKGTMKMATIHSTDAATVLAYVDPRHVVRVPFAWPILETDLRQWSALRILAPQVWRRLRTRADKRHFPEVSYGPWRPIIEEAAEEIHARRPVDLTLGGWGQDGHVAYNQARRHPYQRPSLEELAASTARIQENNLDTILALAQRTFGAAYQFVPDRKSVV